MKVSPIDQVILEPRLTVFKNALLRGLTHAVVPTINLGTHPAFHQFTEYIGIVRDMACLHFEGESKQLLLASELTYESGCCRRPSLPPVGF